MIENETLLQRREELKHQLQAEQYQSLVDVILDGMGRIIQKITRNPRPISFWYSGVVIGLLTLLLSFSVSILLGETNPARIEAIPIEIWTVTMGFSFMIGTKIGLHLIYDTFCDNTLDAIESVEDLDDLRNWLTTSSNIKKQILFSLAIGILSTAFSPLLWAATRGSFAGFGSLMRSFIFGFQAGAAGYYFIPLLALFNRLSKYQFKLYTADPSSSEAIDRLSGMLSSIIYILAVVFVVVTVGIVIFGFFTPVTAIFYLGVITWGPLIVIFANGQYALTRIISRAKWKALNEIQAKIEKLQRQEEIPSQDTVAHIRSLMDYHNHIRDTRNSALSLRSGLNFLNSLLLPLLTFVLTNLDKLGLLL